jgi:hypothetical protein
VFVSPMTPCTVPLTSATTTPTMGNIESASATCREMRARPQEQVWEGGYETQLSHQWVMCAQLVSTAVRCALSCIFPQYMYLLPSCVLVVACIGTM